MSGSLLSSLSKQLCTVLAADAQEKKKTLCRFSVLTHATLAELLSFHAIIQTFRH